jgi:hypothetical protein
MSWDPAVVEFRSRHKPEDFGVFHIYVPDGRPKSQFRKSDLFQNGSIIPQILTAAESRVEFPFVAECCPCETADSTLLNVPFEDHIQDHEEY